MYKEELLCLEEQVRQNVGAENSVQERKASTKDQEVYEKNNEHAQNEDKPIPEKLTDLVVNNHQTLTTGEDPDHLIPVKTKKKETVIGCRCVIV